MKIEEVRKALLVTKEVIEDNLKRLEEKEEETVTLRVQYEAERVDRYDIITIPPSSLCDLKDGYLYIQDELIAVRWGIAMRTTGPLAEKAFLLNEEYDWELGRDKELRLCLVPLKKEE